MPIPVSCLSRCSRISSTTSSTASTEARSKNSEECFLKSTVIAVAVSVSSFRSVVKSKLHVFCMLHQLSDAERQCGIATVIVDWMCWWLWMQSLLLKQSSDLVIERLPPSALLSSFATETRTWCHNQWWQCFAYADSSTTLECLECWIVCMAPTRCFVHHRPINAMSCFLALCRYPFSFPTTRNSMAKPHPSTLWTRTKIANRAYYVYVSLSIWADDCTTIAHFFLG